MLTGFWTLSVPPVTGPGGWKLNWRMKMSKRYILVDGDVVPGRVWRDANGYARHGKDLYIHRTVASGVLGRPLKHPECVHHVNGKKADNRLQNLVICPDAAYHRLLHQRQHVVASGGDPNTDKWCSGHQCVHPKMDFSTTHSFTDGLHVHCRAYTNEYRRQNKLNCDKFDWRARLNQQYRRALRSAKTLITWIQLGEGVQCPLR